MKNVDIHSKTLRIENCVLFFLRHWQNDRDGLRYAAHRVTVRPVEAWEAFLNELRDANEMMLNSVRMRPYDGTVIDKGEAFEISVADRVVKDAYGAFFEALGNASNEHKAEELKPNAMVIKGVTDDKKDIFLISTRSPLMQLRHRFLCADHVYTAITEPVLTLSTRADAMIVGDRMIFLTIAGAQMFVSESICRKIASEKVADVKQVKYLTGLDNFDGIALKGSNIRRFLCYNEKRVKELSRIECRRMIADKFQISMRGNKLDLSNPEDADRFIRVVCNRGMMDPFDETAVEVSSARPWGKRTK